MTQEEKELLLKDLSARLPYHPIVYVDENLQRLKLGAATRVWEYIAVDKPCKPYLRSISSMTKKEVDELFHILKINEENPKEWLKVNDIGIIRLFTEEGKDFYEIAEAIDYLNSIHIDYRGLIEEDLAIIAPEGMYKFNEK